MKVLDYFPIVIAFAMAVIGVSGRTWIEDRPGLSKVTAKGWSVLTISILSLVYGVWTVYANHSSLDEKRAVALLARREIFRGLQFVVQPLCGGIRDTDTEGAIREFRSKDHLRRVGGERLASSIAGGSIFVPSATGGVEVSQPFEADDVEVSEGRKQIEGAEQKYIAYLEPSEVAAYERLLQNKFLNEKYKFSSRKFYIDQGLDDERNGLGDSPWLTKGLYWFNEIYTGSSRREGNYDLYVQFVADIESAVTTLRNNSRNQIYPHLCAL